MSLNSPDQPLPISNKILSEKRENIFTRGVRKFLRRNNTLIQTPTSERGITIWQEGEVPLIEVARIIREQGDVIAKNLYYHYERSFDTPFDLEGRIEDKENKVQLFWPNRSRRDIDVFIVPPSVTEEGYALGRHPKVKFIYDNKNGKWEYETATVHGGGGYVEVNFADEEEDKKRGGHFWTTRVNMRDMERALGKYLNTPESNQAQNQSLPPPTTR